MVARDLLVVPAVGDGPFDRGWLRPLNRALYPPVADRQSPRPAAGVPPFRGKDTVLARPDFRLPDDSTVRPGAYEMRDPVSGAAIRFDGQVAVFDPRQKETPCYHCLFPEGQDVEEVRCAVMGVFAPLTGIIGATQAAEALKLLAGCGTSLAGRLLLLDGLGMEWREIRVPRDPGCQVCGGR